jgi:8-oxo-dGTP diphosphatase
VGFERHNRRERIMAVKRYVLGFMFDPTLSKVVLIRKDKPEWQQDLLNGVGGKVEDGETFENAMIREFEEEAGVVLDWKLFASVNIGQTDPVSPCEIQCFRAIGNVHKVWSAGEEHVQVMDVESVMNRCDLIPNVRWMVQMARSFQFGERAKSFDIFEN